MLLRGNVAFDFSEFLLEAIQPCLHRLLLARTRGEECGEEILIGNSSFLGVTLRRSRICRVKMHGDGHLTFLPESRTNVLCTERMPATVSLGLQPE